MKNLSFEWFMKELNESGTSKWLFDNERNSRDLRLVRGPEAIFPTNRFPETSNSCRDVKFLKQSESEPFRLFQEISNCSRFFNSHQSAQFIYNLLKLVMKTSFSY